jgi:dihydrofolate reductase
MTLLRALNIAVSEDGFMAGPSQSLENPLGLGGTKLHEWAFVTKSFRAWHGESGGEIGIDNDFIREGFENIGATIMGRNMFGPIRGGWSDHDWKGWWGDNPGFKHPVFVLTHFERPTIECENGTSFTFVTGGVDVAYRLAVNAAKKQDVRLGGGASTIQQYLKSGLLDELHIASVPIRLGTGERLLSQDGDDLDAYELEQRVESGPITHLVYRRK